jgi:hypothetical protein
MKKPSRPAKVRKSRSDSPLFLHAAGQWAKKVRGKMQDFEKDKERASRKLADAQICYVLEATERPQSHTAGDETKGTSSSARACRMDM